MSSLAEPNPMLGNPRLIPAAIVAVCLGALGSALASQYWGGLDPCVLCMYQRYAYVAALVLGVIGLVITPRGRALKALILLAAVAFASGAAIAVFHVGVEQQWWRGTESCYAPPVDLNASIDELRQQLLAKKPATCDQIPWSFAGISIAGYNAIASLVFAAGCVWVARR
jgi:disulfide bond formation protein DsbB